jgi:multidrug transporter EmrE-like cation transporter
MKTNMTVLLIGLISIVFSVAAQFCLKAGMSSSPVRIAMETRMSIQGVVALISSPYIIAGFMLYGMGAMIWLAVLARWDVSKAYPLVGFGFVLAALIGLTQGENITLLRMAGIVLIVGGVAVVART